MICLQHELKILRRHFKKHLKSIKVLMTWLNNAISPSNAHAIVSWTRHVAISCTKADACNQLNQPVSTDTVPDW